MELTESEKKVIRNCWRNQRTSHRRWETVCLWVGVIIVWGMTVWLLGQAWEGYQLWQGANQSSTGPGNPSETLMDQFVRFQHLSHAGNAFLLAAFFFVIGLYGLMGCLVEIPMKRRRERLLLRLADRLKDLGEIKESAGSTPSPAGPGAPASQ